LSSGVALSNFFLPHELDTPGACSSGGRGSLAGGEPGREVGCCATARERQRADGGASFDGAFGGGLGGEARNLPRRQRRSEQHDGCNDTNH
jgi:hypothetical protein